MKDHRIKMMTLALGLWVLSASASAQIQPQPPSGIESEVARAYQEGCTPESPSRGEKRKTCSLPALPPNARLAIRYLSARCQDVTGVTRDQEISVSGQTHFEEKTHSLFFSPKRVTSFPSPTYNLSEPVFLHTDVPPQLAVQWQGEGDLACSTIDVFGYLVRNVIR